MDEAAQEQADIAAEGAPRQPPAEETQAPAGEEVAAEAVADDGYIPFKTRFLAWWEGLDPAELARGSALAGDRNGELIVDPPPEEPLADADALRLEHWTRLWGEGFHLPGRAQLTLAMTKPCALDPSKSVLDLAAGLGGGTRAVAKAFGIWVIGLEPSTDLAELGMRLSTRHGLAKRAPISACDPAKLKLPGGKFDCIFARETLYTVADKPRLFRTIRDALKPEGHFVFTDYQLDPERTPGPEIEAWQRSEPLPAHPWTEGQYRALLEELELPVHISQDLTEDYCSMALASWSDYVRRLDEARLSRDFVNMMLVDAELWHRRIMALRRGALRLRRMHAIMPSDPAVSDW